MHVVGVRREQGKPKESIRTRCLNELVTAVKQREERKQEQSDDKQGTKPVSGKPFTKYQVRYYCLSPSGAVTYTSNLTNLNLSCHPYGRPSSAVAVNCLFDEGEIPTCTTILL